MLLPILELCQSSRQEVWIVLVLGYKGLLLLFGLFLAFESRHLKLRFVNDSRFVHLAICNVSVLSLLTGPIVTFFLRHQANAFFGFVSVTGLIFLPKAIHIYKTPHSSSSDDSGSLNFNASDQRSNLYKSDQLRYQQLVKENNELKRQIEIRKIKVAECRRLLGKRLLAAGIHNSSTQSNTTTATGTTTTTSKHYTSLKVATKEFSTTITTDEGFSSASVLGPTSNSNVYTSGSNYSSASSTNLGRSGGGVMPAPMPAAVAAASTIMALTGMVSSGSVTQEIDRMGGMEVEFRGGTFQQ